MSKMNARTLTNLAMGVCALVVGGAVIFSISRFVPVIGGKYLMMAPYLSCVVYLLMRRIPKWYTPIVINLIFGFIMGFINLFMGLAIVSTGLLTALVALLPRKTSQKAIIGSSIYSAFTMLSALSVSRYLIGGVFSEITGSWIVGATILGGIIGGIGTFAGIYLYRFIKPDWQNIR